MVPVCDFAWRVSSKPYMANQTAGVSWDRLPALNFCLLYHLVCVLSVTDMLLFWINYLSLAAYCLHDPMVPSDEETYQVPVSIIYQ